MWERGVRVFERERERAGEYHRLQNTKSSFKVSTESFGCGRKGLGFSRERERAGEYHRLQNTESSFKVSTERFGCGRKG